MSKKSMVRKEGRARRYRLEPRDGFADATAARYVAALDELSARVLDQIAYLGAEDLNRTPCNETLSVGRLAIHLAWGEHNWMRRIEASTTRPGAESQNAAGPAALPMETPPDIASLLEKGKLADFDKSPPGVDTVNDLEQLCHWVRENLTVPVCRQLPDMQLRIDDSPLRTAGEVLHHLMWHWTYHSGHIGLLTHQLGYDYVWKFEQ